MTSSGARYNLGLQHNSTDSADVRPETCMQSWTQPLWRQRHMPPLILGTSGTVPLKNWQSHFGEITWFWTCISRASYTTHYTCTHRGGGEEKGEGKGGERRGEGTEVVPQIFQNVVASLHGIYLKNIIEGPNKKRLATENRFLFDLKCRTGKMGIAMCSIENNWGKECNVQV